MSHRDDKIASFKDALNEMPELWRSLDVRTAAIYSGGEWHNVLTSVRIDTRLPEDLPELTDLPATTLVRSWQERLPAAELPHVIEDIVNGKRTVANNEILFLELTEAHALNGGVYSDAWLALENRRVAVSSVHHPREYVAHYLDLRSGRPGPSVASTVAGGDQAVRRSLESAETPWEGLSGLARVGFGSSAKPEEQGQPLVEFIAPLGLAFEREHVVLQDGVLTVGLWAGSRGSALRATVGYIAEGIDRSYRTGTVRIHPGSWEGESEQRGTGSAVLGPGFKKVTLLARLGSSVVDRHTAEDRGPGSENIHLMLYKELDPNLVRLKRALAVSDKDAREKHDVASQFEHAVARIFSVAGFHADALGSARGVQQSFDVLARTPNGEIVIAVECTVGALNTKMASPIGSWAESMTFGAHPASLGARSFRSWQQEGTALVSRSSI